MGIPVFVLLILFLAWRGWRKGLVRAGVSLLALVFAFGAGSWAYESRDCQFFSFLGTYSNAVAAFLVGLLVYLAIMVPTAILFKNTTQQAAGLRLLYGIGGALCGATMGVLILWGFCSFVGAFHSNTVRTAGDTSFSVKRMPRSVSGRYLSREISESHPASFYNTLYKMGRVLSDQRALSRFLCFPDVKRVLETEAMSELIGTWQFAKALSREEVIALLFNAKLYQTLTDPEVEHAINGINFQKALDYALATSSIP